AEKYAQLAMLLALTSMAGSAVAAPRFVELPGKSPLVTLRFVFTTGSASDPAEKPGVAHLTGEMLGGGGTKDLTYKQIVDAMYPMATSVHVYSDKEMTTFVGETHRDNLDKFYGLMRDMILHPGWRADDFARIRDDSINALRVSLRDNNDEELGKEELYNVIYEGRPYGHENLGTAAALQKMTIADLQEFYRQHYTQANLVIGIAGGYPPEFSARVKRDFEELPAGAADRFDNLAAPPAISHTRVTLIQKDTRSVAWSPGFPIDVKRGDPDFPALLLMTSWLGQHRQGGRLFQRLREVRGLNYGDYAYVEYFPQGMFRLDPQPNLARHQQIFQIWIRPVEPPNAVFSLRLAMYELDRMVKNGIPEQDFEKTRSFLSKYVNVLTKTKSAELGYAIDSAYYGIPDYNEYIRSALAKLTAADVNAAIRRHLHTDNMEIVGVAKDADAIRAALTGSDPTPPHYNSAKPQDILDEDKIVERFPLNLRKEDVTVVPVGTVFEK
ncbi:MAG TPA: pitrilysin family protein, partial [Bryobacteraceae bacterium]|nr:pitrilysin family protein [Bryobacteraceae bacterium]